MRATANNPQTASAAVERYFEISLFLLLATGFVTLAATGSVDIPTTAFVGGALLLRGVFLVQRRTLLIPDSWTTFLTLGYVIFYLSDYFVLSGSFLKATVHLVLFVMIVRLFSAHRDRDYYFLSVLSFLMVLAAAVLTIRGIFLAGFALFTLTAVVTVILMEMRRASATSVIQSTAAADGGLSRRLGWTLLAASPAIVLFIFLGAAAIFLVLPRISSRYLTAYASGTDISTGFSDHIRLGGIGQIQQSSALIMHIKIDGAQSGSPTVKWRGVALSLFDGTSWSNPHDLRILPQSQDGRRTLQPSGANSVNPNYATYKSNAVVSPVRYRVLMEPVGSNVFFLLSKPLEIDGNYRLVGADEAGAVFNLDPEHPITTYNAESDPSQPAPANLRLAYGLSPPGILLNDLQLPRLDPRIPRLTQEITASASSNYDKAIALESYLQTSYGYTLQLSRTLPADPLADFLFRRKQGHCEYFASAMAVMLRTLRIPSRVVNGFRGGELNRLTGQYIVRASDAHSWVEAYFPGYGWVTFDPTPAAAPGASNSFSRAALYFDALSSFWREWVVNYDSSHQTGLARDAVHDSQHRLLRLRQWANRTYRALLVRSRQAHTKISQAPRRWITIATAIATLLLLLSTAGKITRFCRTWVRASRPEKAPGAAAAIWYLRMTRKVGSRGWRKSAAQTPCEFAQSIDDPTLRSRVALFTSTYESARFGDSVDDAIRLPELYAEVADAIKLK